MTCCKFSTGCYLNCDLAACRSWCRKYLPKICGLCGVSRFACKGKRSGSKLKPSRSNTINTSSKTCRAPSKIAEFNESKGKILGSSTSANKIIDVENDDDEFCDCDLQEPVSFVSCDPSNPIVAKVQGAIQSLTSIISKPSKTSQCSLDRKGSSVKVLMHPNTKSSDYCEPHSCGRQISMAALIGKIRESVPCLSKVGDLCGKDSLCGKVISKCKSLDCVQGYEKPCILLNKLNNIKNNVAEIHQKLTGIIPRVCMTFDKTNKRVIVTPGKPCDDVVTQCQKEGSCSYSANQCKKVENNPNNSNQCRKEENYHNNPSLPPKPPKRARKCSIDPNQSENEEKYSINSNQCKKEDQYSNDPSSQCSYEDSYSNNSDQYKKEDRYSNISSQSKKEEKYSNNR